MFIIQSVASFETQTHLIIPSRAAKKHRLVHRFSHFRLLLFIAV